MPDWMRKDFDQELERRKQLVSPGFQAGLAGVLEDLKNWQGVQQWEMEKAIDQPLDEAKRANGQYVFPDPVSAREAFDQLMGFGVGDMGKPAMFGQAIKAYHGSPHLFDQFDMSKIGTGEGGQAFGHGLYFAESPDVAETYARVISNDGGWNSGVDFFSDVPRIIKDAVPENVLSELNANYLSNGPESVKNSLLRMIDKSNVSSERDFMIDLYRSTQWDKPPVGNVYKSYLEWPDQSREAADPMGPQHFLDWDRPLSEQPDFVQNAWAKFTNKYPAYLNPELSGGQYKKPTGRDFYSAIFEETPGMGEQARAKVTARLKKERIPGIRYLDQGSRDASDGTFNYVVFDDQIPRIVARNGVPINKK